MRLVFIQHGDYREAYGRLAAGGAENYYAQRCTVDYVGDLAGRFEHVVVVCVDTARHDPIRLPNGVLTVGMPLYRGATEDDLLRVVEAHHPTHVILRTPMIAVLQRAIERSWAILPLLADSFDQRGLRTYWRQRKLRGALNHPAVPWVGNHGIAASHSLRRLGVTAAKILPYDVPAPDNPANAAPKEAPSEGEAWRLLYAGSLKWSKGVGDAISALGILRGSGYDAALTVLGDDADGEFQRYAVKSGMAGHVDFKGRVAHGEVLQQMRRHHAVLVPSRHEFPEGIPYVIYDAFCARTPPVTSDHPMLAANIDDGETGMIARAADPSSLASACIRLLTNPDRYRALSQNSAAAWQRLQMKVEWSDVIRRFLEGPQKHAGWLREHCLAGAGVREPARAAVYASQPAAPWRGWMPPIRFRRAARAAVNATPAHLPPGAPRA